MTSVFLPCTPNPTTGFYFFIPTADVIELPMTPEDAVKLIVSAGVVQPEGQAALAAMAHAARHEHAPEAIAPHGRGGGIVWRRGRPARSIEEHRCRVQAIDTRGDDGAASRGRRFRRRLSPDRRSAGARRRRGCAARVFAHAPLDQRASRVAQPACRLDRPEGDRRSSGRQRRLPRRRRAASASFPSSAETPDRIVMGFDDWHLDFRVVVDVAVARRRPPAGDGDDAGAHA